MKDNSFTEFCCFLSNLNMNQPQVYMYPLPFESLFPSHPSRLIQSPCLIDNSKFPLPIYFTYGNISFHVTLSIHLTLSSPLPMSISLFSISVSHRCPVNKFFSTIFLDSIYMCQNNAFIFRFLTHFTLYNRFQVHPAHQN